MAAELQIEPKIPLLHAGDRMTTPEFLRRYHAMPEDVSAELIEGVVYMTPPISFENHTEPNSNLGYWLNHYRLHTPGVRGGGEATVKLDAANCPQPDALLIRPPAGDGRSQVIDTYIVGPPELVIEIAASTVGRNLHDKKHAYQRSGVLEYIVWRVKDRQIDWFVLRNGVYEDLVAADGVLKSTVFPGLWLDASALVAGDLKRVLDVLQQGLASDEHAGFVAELQRRLANV